MTCISDGFGVPYPFDGWMESREGQPGKVQVCATCHVEFFVPLSADAKPIGVDPYAAHFTVVGG